MTRKRRVPDTAILVAPATASTSSSSRFPPSRGFAIRHPCEVTAGISETFHDPKPDRIRHESEHDRDRQSAFSIATTAGEVIAMITSGFCAPT